MTTTTRFTQRARLAAAAAVATALVTTVIAHTAGSVKPFSPREYALLHGTHPRTAGMAEPNSTTPLARCGAGSLPEGPVQGRVPAADYANGRAAKGYLCNTMQVGHYGASGGFHVFRYVDQARHVCAIYDSTYVFPENAFRDINTGTFVLDMTHPGQPIRTAVLRTLAMQSPHESLRLNEKRGLLIATTGGPTTMAGTMDIYDLRSDCRNPRLRSTLPINLLGHEGGFSADGLTYWATVTAAGGLTAIDVSNPDLPTVLWSSTKWAVHGLGLSPDGNRAYLADMGTSPISPALDLLQGGGGMTILDVSEVQARVFQPKVRQLSTLSWPEMSIPQNNIPVTIKGREYTIEFDEYDSSVLHYVASSTVGGIHILDTANSTKPRIVSRIRLQVWDRANRVGDQSKDPGATRVGQGYAAHYCSVPTLVNPTMLACSMIMSGLRIYDIRDPMHPREIAYFNKPPIKPADPSVMGSYAMSAPAFDIAHKQIWYSDANSGFYAVRLTNGAWLG